MIESARRHGPFDPRFSASARKDPEAIARQHQRELEAAKHLEEVRRDAAGWAALQAWEEDGGAVQ
jgi:hypothetical protein